MEQQKIESKKEGLKKDMQARLKEDKKRAEKENNQRIRDKRLEADEELDTAKMETKRATIQTYELKE